MPLPSFDKLNPKKRKEALLAPYEQEIILLRESLAIERQRIVNSTSKTTENLNITISALNKLINADPTNNVGLLSQESFFAQMMDDQMKLGDLSFRPDRRKDEREPSPFSVINFDPDKHEGIEPRVIRQKEQLDEVLDYDIQPGDKVVVISSAIYNDKDNKKQTPTRVIKLKPGKSISLTIDGVGDVQVDSEGNITRETGSLRSAFRLEKSAYTGSSRKRDKQ